MLFGSQNGTGGADLPAAQIHDAQNLALGQIAIPAFERRGITLTNLDPIEQVATSLQLPDRIAIQRMAYMGDALLALSLMELQQRYFGLRSIETFFVSGDFSHWISNATLTKLAESRHNEGLLHSLGLAINSDLGSDWHVGTFVEATIAAIQRGGSHSAARAFVDQFYGYPKPSGSHRYHIISPQILNQELDTLRVAADSLLPMVMEDAKFPFESPSDILALDRIGRLAGIYALRLDLCRNHPQMKLSEINAAASELARNTSPLGRFDEAARSRWPQGNLLKAARPSPFFNEWGIVGARFLVDGIESVIQLARTNYNFLSLPNTPHPTDTSKDHYGVVDLNSTSLPILEATLKLEMELQAYVHGTVVYEDLKILVRGEPRTLSKLWIGQRCAGTAVAADAKIAHEAAAEDAIFALESGKLKLKRRG